MALCGKCASRLPRSHAVCAYSCVLCGNTCGTSRIVCPYSRAYSMRAHGLIAKAYALKVHPIWGHGPKGCASVGWCLYSHRRTAHGAAVRSISTSS